MKENDINLTSLVATSSDNKLLGTDRKAEYMEGYEPIGAGSGVPKERAVDFINQFPVHSPVVLQRLVEALKARGNMDANILTDPNMASVFEFYWSACHQIPLFYEKKGGDLPALNSLQNLENDLPIPQPTIYQLVFFLNHALGLLSIEQAIDTVNGEVGKVVPELIVNQTISKPDFVKLFESVIEYFTKKPLSPESIQKMVNLAIKGLYSTNESIWAFDEKQEIFSLESFEIAITYYLEMLLEMTFEEQLSDQANVKAKIQSIIDKSEPSAYASNSWEGQVLRFLKQSVKGRIFKNPLHSTGAEALYGSYGTTMQNVMRIYHSKDRGLPNQEKTPQLRAL